MPEEADPRDQPLDRASAPDGERAHPQTSQRPPEPRSFEAADDGASSGRLFHADDAARLRGAWLEVQTSFVDDPRAAVARADTLVGDTIRHLADIFAAERASLERQWGQKDEASTENLRQALQLYRAFFNRLLSASSSTAADQPTPEDRGNGLSEQDVADLASKEEAAGIVDQQAIASAAPVSPRDEQG